MPSVLVDPRETLPSFFNSSRPSLSHAHRVSGDWRGVYFNPVASSWVYSLHLSMCDELFVLSFTVTKVVHQGRRGCCGDEERMRKRPEGVCWGCSRLWPAGPGSAAWSTGAAGAGPAVA